MRFIDFIILYILHFDHPSIIYYVYTKLNSENQYRLRFQGFVLTIFPFYIYLVLLKRNCFFSSQIFFFRLRFSNIENTPLRSSPLPLIDGKHPEDFSRQKTPIKAIPKCNNLSSYGRNHECENFASQMAPRAVLTSSLKCMYVCAYIYTGSGFIPPHPQLKTVHVGGENTEWRYPMNIESWNSLNS